MANKKRKRAEKPKLEQTEEGVVVRYPNRVVQPALAPLRQRRCCPMCGEGPVPSHCRYGATQTNYLYECPKCVDSETCRPTRWQEPR